MPNPSAAPSSGDVVGLLAKTGTLPDSNKSLRMATVSRPQSTVGGGLRKLTQSAKTALEVMHAVFRAADVCIVHVSYLRVCGNPWKGIGVWHNVCYFLMSEYPKDF